MIFSFIAPGKLLKLVRWEQLMMEGFRVVENYGSLSKMGCDIMSSRRKYVQVCLWEKRSTQEKKMVSSGFHA